MYTVYCAACVAWCILGVSDYSSMNLGVLSSLLNLVGTSLFLLQAFRVNSSYGAALSRKCFTACTLPCVIHLSIIMLVDSCCTSSTDDTPWL